jgi:hypothetical protein
MGIFKFKLGFDITQWFSAMLFAVTASVRCMILDTLETRKIKFRPGLGYQVTVYDE